MAFYSFTGFSVLQSILCLHSISLPWQIFPILWTIFSVYLFSLLFQLVFSGNFRPLFQFCGLVPSILSTKFYTHCLPQWFSSHLAIFSLSSFIHFPSLANFPHCWTYFSSQFFSHLVSLPHTSLPNSSIHLANSGCVITPMSKRVTEITESLLLRIR